MIRQPVYINRDNINIVKFRVNGQIKPLTPITKMEIRIKDLDITITDSTPSDFPIKWLFDPVQEGVMEYQIGSTTGLIVGIYKADIYIFDTDTPNGEYFSTIELNIKD